MSDARFTLAQLQRELHDLTESITGYAPPPKPDRFERDNQNKIGPEWYVPTTTPRKWWPDRLVRVIDGEPEVWLEGGPYLSEGDMTPVTTSEARAFAMALLAAAAWADGQDEIGQRRAQAETGGHV